MTAAVRPLVVCLVGTDHHPFARLVGWCDALATARPDVDVFVQYGRSLPPTVAEGRDFLSREDLDALLAKAQVAVTHGGPGLISEIRAVGLHPISVPRDPMRGEHVDEHQLQFVERMAKNGLVDSITTEQPFLDRIAWRLTQPVHMQVDPLLEEMRVRASVEHFAGLVDEILGIPADDQGALDRRRPRFHQA